jgi:CRISPR-associated protein Csx10
MTLFLELELLADTALTAHSATLGGHRTLEYIPGASILGAVASTHYGDHGLSRGAWRLFHSGEVRFGHAFPLSSGGQPGWPVPLSFHHPKHDKSATINLARADRTPGVQYKQLREELVDHDGRIVHVARTGSMRTAIGAEGRVRDGFLFGLQAVTQGTRFLSTIEADDPGLLEPIRQALLAGEIRVGRSRSAELGRVGVKLLEPCQARPAESKEQPGEWLLVWCLSDLALRDPNTGQPTLTPWPELLGLPEGNALDLGRSFLRTRRYSPFRRFGGPSTGQARPDLERQVIQAGSVLAFRTGRLDSTELARVRKVAAAGLGEYRCEGLGQVSVEPTILAPGFPLFKQPSQARDVAPGEPPRPSATPQDPLFAWIQVRHERTQADFEADEEAARWLEELGGRVLKIPASQWGELRQMTRVAGVQGGELLPQLRMFLGGEQERGVRASRWRGLGQLVRAKLEALAGRGMTRQQQARVLELLAIRAQRKVNQEKQP